MLHAERLTVDFQRSRRAKLRALDSVTLDIPKGAFFALLGENGAGKSTAMHCFLGLLRPTSGSVTIDGQYPRLGSRIFERIAYLPEEPHYPDFLTVEEAITFYAALFRHPVSAAQRSDLLQRLGLLPFRNLRVGKCSKGMKQKVGIAQSLLNTPELLFLDEPMRGLDPAGVHDFRDILVEMNRNGATIVMNSHILAEVEAVATQIAILHRGRVVASGDVASLTRIEGESYDVAFACAELPPMVSNAQNANSHWTASASKDALPDLLGFLGAHSGSLISCELRRMSLEERFLSIVKEERSRG
jgi:ABC-2 type transport system ATP-binding protein